MREVGQDHIQACLVGKQLQRTRAVLVYCNQFKVIANPEVYHIASSIRADNANRKILDAYKMKKVIPARSRAHIYMVKHQRGEVTTPCDFQRYLGAHDLRSLELAYLIL